jgi:hypothetical protein
MFASLLTTYSKNNFNGIIMKNDKPSLINRPLANFTLSFLLPALFFYGFAFQSFEAISKLKAENKHLAGNPNIVAPPDTTSKTSVIIRDTVKIIVPMHDTVSTSLIKHDTVFITTVKHDTIRISLPGERLKTLRDSIDLLTRAIIECNRGKKDFKNNFSGLLKVLENGVRDTTFADPRRRLTLLNGFIKNTKDLVDNY